MENDRLHRFPVSSWVVILLLPLLLIHYQQQRGNNFPTMLLYEADQSYKNHQYQNALENYQKAISENPAFANRFPFLSFKLGYCFLKTNQPQQAIQFFERDDGSGESLADYRYYFLAQSYLLSGDTLSALRTLDTARQVNPRTAIRSLIDSLRAELFFTQQVWDSAYACYSRVRRVRRFDRSEIQYKMFRIAIVNKWDANIRELGFTMLRRFPLHPRSFWVYEQLVERFGNDFSRKEFSQAMDYLFNTRHFSRAGGLIDRWEKKNGVSEFSRWLKIRLLYVRGNYRETLNACKSERRYFKSSKYLREIDLHIARSYLKLGNVEKSIAAYGSFQKRYPGDRLAAEVLWKIAWLYEEQKDPVRARKYYQKLVEHYPRSQFVREARFRLGMSFYRDGEYDVARNYFLKFLKSEKSDFWKARYTYWVAKTYLKQQGFVEYLRLLDQLSRTPFQSYYNLKAYLLTKDGVNQHSYVDSLLWELHHQQVSFLPRYLDNFRKMMVVRELIGEKFADYELRNLGEEQPDEEDWKYQFAFAELNERFANYGRAYRLFRSIYNVHFSNADWSNWLFLFKRLYPLYYDRTVAEASEKWKIPASAIWSVMKKESAFEPQIVSYANAYGLMQLIPPTAREVTRKLNLPFEDPRQLFDARMNIQLGTFYLATLLRRYQGNYYYALAAYNAGPHRVDRWRKLIQTGDDDLFLENIEFEQTRVYVRTVMRYYWTYFMLMNPQKIPTDVFPFPETITSEMPIEENPLGE